ncbi:MAG: hypothetical protein JKY96_06380 [Phycisphaerales bacterium]|nr:hypothetical protein [Phycisphaerales bacterium]
MAIKIETAKELDRARARTSFCFLCGTPFRGFDGTKPSCATDEHIVPKGVLGKGVGDNRKPAILWVHAKCDRESKQKQDGTSSAYYSLNLLDPDDWSEDRLNQIRSVFNRPVHLEDGRRVPAASAGILIRACRDWVRGFHALLYEVYLPSRNDVFCINPPFLTFRVTPSNTGDSVRIEDLKKNAGAMATNWSMVDGLLRLAEKHGHMDTVRCWGEELIFKSVWINTTKELSKKYRVGSTCFWSLEHPGIRKLSFEVHQVEMVWHGIYHTQCCPSGAARAE